MKFYSFEDIKSSADCVDIARQVGLDVLDGRCAAKWRGGTNDTSVSVNRDGWHDFATEESGSAIDLVALNLFGGDRQKAQEWLGDYLRLTPVYDKLSPAIKSETTRYHKLIEDGYIEKARYCYADENGEALHYTIRLEKEGEPKEFVQMSADGRWTLKGTRTVLYNLKAIIPAKWVIVVEGEKDADNLIQIGLPATTNAMGAKKWIPEYSETLRGKDVVIIADNDEPGRTHADLVAGHLCNIAKSVRIIVISSLPKGDVTDWLQFEGGSKDSLMQKIKDAKPIDMRVIDEQFQIAKAKEANKTPFRNYTIDVQQAAGGNQKFIQIPVQINTLVEQVFTRFLGFPRRVGEELFDRDRDTGSINYIRSPQQLFAWISQKSKQIIEWSRNTGMVSQEQFFEGLKYAAPKYEGISSVPDYPRRADVYYCHPPLPVPSDRHSALDGLVDFFSPESPEYRLLIKAFVAAPLYYETYEPRPMWIIDSESPGAGKSTLASRVAMLYGAPPVEVKTRDLERDIMEVTKRLVSPEGRQSRMLLIDNVIGTFESPELSSMVTMPYITGRPPYGRGEERRPNNLTYVITANNASIDNDISMRSYFIKLKTIEEYDPEWSEKLTYYIVANRLQIMADIMDILNRPSRVSMQPFTRFPKFEVRIVQALARSNDEYINAINKIAESRSAANIESELGRIIEDVIASKLTELNIINRSAFIRSQVIEEWLRKPLQARPGQHITQLVRNISKSGHCQHIDITRQLYPFNGPHSRRGVMWIVNDGEKNPHLIVAKNGDQTKVIEI